MGLPTGSTKDGSVGRKLALSKVKHLATVIEADPQ